MEDDGQVQYPPYPDEIAEQISMLPSESHYVLIYPREDMLKGKYEPIFNQKHMKPYMLTFEDDENTTGLDLIRQYIKQNNINANEKHVHFQEYRTDCFIDQKTDLATLKRNLEDQTVDGYCFLVSIVETWVDLQASIHQMIGFENKHKPDQRITFYILENNFYFYVKQEKIDTWNSFRRKISNQIRETNGVIVRPQKLRLTYMNNKNEVAVDDRNYTKLTNRDYVYVTFLDKVKLPKQLFENETQFIAFKDYGSNQQIKISYKQVRRMQIKTILDKFFDFPKKKLNSCQFGLRIHDLILKSCEMLADFPELQQNFFGQSRYIKIVLALVIRESDMFYTHLEGMEDLNSAQNKKYFKGILANSKKNETHRRKCDEEIKARAKLSPLTVFKNQQNIEPIMYYTSNIEVKVRNQPQQLYQACNAFLRKMQFGTIDRQKYNQWELLFTRSLVKSLKFINQYKGEVYRGVTTNEKYYKGKIMKFKQFLSCSTDINVALRFAGTALYVFKNCKIARSIKPYSFFPDEEEALNLPYTEYRVTDLTPFSYEGNKLTRVTLEETYFPKVSFDLNDQPLLFVLWVDGQEGEGVEFSKNIQNVRQSTSFIHLTSTKQLKTWLEKNQQTLKDKTISTVLITNMTRTEENGIENGLAGVEAIKVYRLLQPQGKIMLYIGNLEAAKAKLTQNQIPLNTVSLGNTDYSLLTFFLNNCGIS